MGLSRKLSAEEQETVRGWLSGLNGACEEIFLSFCRLADADEFPGRARLLGHCIRELRIRLLAHFVGEQIERLDYPAELRAIDDEMEIDGSGASNVISNANTPSETPPMIGANAVRKIRELIDKSKAMTATLEVQLAELLRRLRFDAGGPDSNLRAVAKDFKRVTDTDKIAHSPFTDAELITDEFARRLKDFEEHLYNFATAARFVERLEILDDLLDQANRRAS